VASDLRFRIDGVFREAGVEIAFPQRDLHLDAKSALPVRIVREGGGPGAET
jgi:small-conductance mechanosensitive channel